MIIERTGDLFTTDSNYIGHGVNCKGAMRAGIATQFSTRFPQMYHEYKQTCRFGGLHPGEVFLYHDDEFDIANIASQYRPGNDARYSWVLKGIKEALDLGIGQHKSLSIPRIGCGIGGLEWEVLKEDLFYQLSDHPVDLIIYSL